MAKATQKEELRSADFRAMAREALKGKWKKGFFFFLLSNLLFSGLGLHLVQEHFFTDDAVPSPVMEAFGLVPNDQQTVGFGWVILAVLLVWSLVNGFLHAGMYRTCLHALDGGELRLKDLLPTKLFGRAALMGGMRTILLTIPELLAGLCLKYKSVAAEFAVNPAEADCGASGRFSGGGPENGGLPDGEG